MHLKEKHSGPILYYDNINIIILIVIKSTSPIIYRFLFFIRFNKIAPILFRIYFSIPSSILARRCSTKYILVMICLHFTQFLFLPLPYHPRILAVGHRLLSSYQYYLLPSMEWTVRHPFDASPIYDQDVDVLSLCKNSLCASDLASH